MHKFNSDLELKHIQHEDRIAVYHYKKKEEHEFFSPVIAMVKHGKGIAVSYVVASFNDCLYCNNAQEFEEYTEAWKFFVSLVQEDFDNA